jgi:hypothetical protein
MVRIVQLSDDGSELASIHLDDFTVEVIYAGIADMLRAAAEAAGNGADAACAAASGSNELAPGARQRREKILTRLRD